MGPSSPGRPGFLGELECLAEKHQEKGHQPLVEPPIPLQLQVATPVPLASRSCSSWTQGTAGVTPCPGLPGRKRFLRMADVPC